MTPARVARALPAVALASLVALASAAGGCRAIVGIEDLALVEAGAEGGAHDAGPTDSSGGMDSATQDSGGMDSAHVDSGSTCGSTNTTRGPCGMCCASQAGNMAQQQFMQLAMQQFGAGSCACMICSGGGAPPCSPQTVVCGGSTQIGMTMCGGCINNLLIANTCPNLITACETNATCKPLADCMATCSSLPM